MIFCPHFLFFKLPKATAHRRVVGAGHPLWFCKTSSMAGTGPWALLGPALHLHFPTRTYLSIPSPRAWAPPVLTGAAPSRLNDPLTRTSGQHTAVPPAPVLPHQWRRVQVPRANKPRRLITHSSVNLATAGEYSQATVNSSDKCFNTGHPEIPWPMPPCCQLDVISGSHF